MHSYWDVIVDGERLVRGELTTLGQDAAAWIAQAELLLAATAPRMARS